MLLVFISTLQRKGKKRVSAELSHAGPRDMLKWVNDKRNNWNIGFKLNSKSKLKLKSNISEYQGIIKIRIYDILNSEYVPIILDWKTSICSFHFLNTTHLW